MADINVGGTLHSIATGNIIAYAKEVKDDNWAGDKQDLQTINAELKAAIANAGAGSVKKVTILGEDGIEVTGNPITDTGTYTIGVDSNHYLPLTSDKTKWDSVANGAYVSISGDTMTGVLTIDTSDKDLDYPLVLKTKSTKGALIAFDDTYNNYLGYDKLRDFIVTNSLIAIKIATGAAPLSIASTTKVNNLNVDMLDGFHESSFFRQREDATVDGEETLYRLQGIKHYESLHPDGLPNVYGYGNAITFSANTRHLDIYHTDNATSSPNKDQGIFVRTYHGNTAQNKANYWKLLAFTESTVGYIEKSFDQNTSYIKNFKDLFPTINDSKPYAVRISKGPMSMAFGWFLGSNDYNTIDKAYGGWFISSYNIPKWLGIANGNWEEHTFAFLDSTVAAADKLSTPVTIWGLSFDGSSNIDGNMTNVGDITFKGEEYYQPKIYSDDDGNLRLKTGYEYIYIHDSCIINTDGDILANELHINNNDASIDWEGNAIFKSVNSNRITYKVLKNGGNNSDDVSPSFLSILTASNNLLYYSISSLVQSSVTLGVPEDMTDGLEIHIVVYNNGSYAAAISIPTRYTLDENTSDVIDIEPRTYKEINIIYIGGRYFLRHS